MTNISFALLAILCIASLALSFFAARFAVRRTESPLAKQASFESRLRSIEAFQLEQAETLSQLANRVKMQRVRTAINHVSDPEIEPASIKDQLRRKAGLVAGKPAPHQ
jgi:hypothetical protein